MILNGGANVSKGSVDGHLTGGLRNYPRKTPFDWPALGQGAGEKGLDIRALPQTGWFWLDIKSGMALAALHRRGVCPCILRITRRKSTRTPATAAYPLNYASQGGRRRRPTGNTEQVGAQTTGEEFKSAAITPGRRRQSFQNPLNRSDASSVYLTVCWMFLCPM
jgi:hypothetical protein